jgi:hypothetical protein
MAVLDRETLPSTRSWINLMEPPVAQEASYVPFVMTAASFRKVSHGPKAQPSPPPLSAGADSPNGGRSGDVHETKISNSEAILTTATPEQFNFGFSATQEAPATRPQRGRIAFDPVTIVSNRLSQSTDITEVAHSHIHNVVTRHLSCEVSDNRCGTEQSYCPRSDARSSIECESQFPCAQTFRSTPSRRGEDLESDNNSSHTGSTDPARKAHETMGGNRFSHRHRKCRTLRLVAASLETIGA